MKSTTRFNFLLYGMYLCLLIVSAGLFRTQVINGSDYREASERNRIRLIRREAPRGNIYDRNGLPVATNRPALYAYIIPEDFDPKDIPELSPLLGLTEWDIRQRISKARGASFTPVLLKSDLSLDTAMQIEEKRPKFSGVFIQVKAIRFYPQHETAAHVVGYIGKMTKEEYEKLDHSVYGYDSWIGRSGIERLYDQMLRGEDGGVQLEVNARGVPINVLSEKDVTVGHDLYISIDANFESKVRPLLAGQKGAILVGDIKTGGLLTAISTPGFDPNVFVTPEQKKERLDVIGSKEKPLLNRGFNGLYPPGSVFKLLTAIAGLETGVITPHTTFTCRGFFKLNRKSRPYKCWYKGGHGRVDFYRALERSCNVYFYNVGRLLGEKRLAEYARKFGFGSPVDLSFPNVSGVVPDQEWKKKAVHDQWYTGDTISFAIGQGYLLVSPLQILQMVTTIATDGRVSKPLLIFDKNEPSKTELGIHPETFKALKQGMLQVVQSDYGTGQLARVDFEKLAGKTGTAQAPPGLPHAWMGAFFPYEDPKIAIVVFVERGKSGGIAAANMVKEVVRIWNEAYGTAVI
ncbi:MAG: penicillin-binding protein 2 [Omnitrophica bacterium RIFCSPLOWO2_12_FULL_44_17]|uniref:Penicillin-binding protein 2 n=1 Tax=Candidatus Danuiimicrobium aquiferis TaxID=1801832 RepID=A0A1G1KRL6_9BACT|nr:MAG: penicillin-binding protein 2 [Omnitrophica bacterium RIFCSPLOWO2_12_FULL_44_17]